MHALGLPTYLAALFVGIFLMGEYFSLVNFLMLCVASVIVYILYFKGLYRMCCSRAPDKGHPYFYTFIFVSQLLFWWLVVNARL